MEATILKPWLSLDGQIVLLQQRGLIVEDVEECRFRLARVGYYHLSGYGRYFQIDPVNGDNRFQPGTRFEDIATIQSLDAALRAMCLPALADVELALRTGFAYRFVERHRAAGALWHPGSYTTTGARSRGVHDYLLDDLNKAKQHFINRYRVAPDSYPELPAWVAVEAISFGSLSRAIEHCADVEVRKSLAADLNVGQRGFSSQIRSFVNLRNTCAHSGRLWNDVAHMQPSVPNNVLYRAKRRMGNFSAGSNYQIVVALAQFMPDAAKSASFIAGVDGVLSSNENLRNGWLNPGSYSK